MGSLGRDEWVSILVLGSWSKPFALACSDKPAPIFIHPVILQHLLFCASYWPLHQFHMLKFCALGPTMEHSMTHMASSLSVQGQVSIRKGKLAEIHERITLTSTGKGDIQCVPT